MKNIKWGAVAASLLLLTSWGSASADEQALETQPKSQQAASTAAQESEGTMSKLLATENFSNTIYLTTDYIFRGISFSNRNPALQGSFDYGYNNYYVGVWGSTISGLDGGATELDFYVGYADSLGPIDYDLTAIYYFFPGVNDDDLETDQAEGWITLGHTFADLPLAPTVSLFGGFSPNFTLEDGLGQFYKGSVAFALPRGFGLDGGVGYQSVEGDKATGSNGAFCDPATNTLCNGYQYVTWDIGVTKEIKGFNFDVRYHDTNESDSLSAFYGTDPIDATVNFTISRTF